MARAISVKVSTAKVIKALEDKISESVIAEKNNETKRKQHQQDLRDYYKSILANFGDKLEIDSISTRWNGQVEVTYKKLQNFDVPEQPELNLEQELGQWEVKEIENAIRILKMTDEEVVNASTFKTIAQYL